MHWLLSRLATMVRDRPRQVIAGAVVLTVVLGGFAANQTTDTELTSFAPDSEAAAAFDRARVEFGGGGDTLQVIVDAGPGGNVWRPDGLGVALEVTEALERELDATGVEVDRVTSFAQPVLAHLDAAGAGLDTAGDDQIATAVRAAPEQVTQLSSQDADPGAGTARAGLVVVSFPSDLGEAAVQDASLALAAAVDGLGSADVTVSAFNAAVLGQALLEESEAEMPMLFGLALLVILAILLFQFRTVSDVLIAFVALLASIVWMMGIGVLLGPDHLGVVGPFSQIAMIVPVLLVSLGIDYSIHLTTRYREERSHGVTPERSAATAVRTVGGALVLATVTTTVGFLTNLASPLPPIADFGVFTAVGVLCAFVILTAVVPAARNLLDTRRLRRGRMAAAPRPAAGLSTAIGRTSVLAQRAPKVVLGVALAISLAAVGAATQVSTSFSQDDFVPESSDIGQLMDRMVDLFAGDVNETTYVVLDGDLTDPAALDAIARFDEAVAGIDDVRSNGDAVQLSSPAAVLGGLAGRDAETAARFAALGYTPGDGLAAGADVAGLFDLAAGIDPAPVAGAVSPDRTTGLIAIGTTAGQDDAKALADRLDAQLADVRAAGLTATVTSEPLVIDESLDALTASQTRGIAITIAAALALLVAYYGLTDRKPLLGVITMISSLVVVSWVLGTMWLLGISFNVLTAMVASLGIGIGVPFGIHITHRFLEDRRRYDTVDEAIYHTVRHTGGAMAGTAATTAGGFGVLIFASLIPIQQFGIIVAITIAYSFVAAVVIQPSCLKLWAEHRARRGDLAVLLAHEHRDVLLPTDSTGTGSANGSNNGDVTGRGADSAVPAGGAPAPAPGP